MNLDVVLLSRLQFAITIMFHYLFPPLTIGMGVVLVYLEGMYLRTKEPIYETAAKFWTSLFAVNFGIGVATGIVMEFQFGTNWAAYSRFVGDVFGSALAAEGIFAFFLESGFLAVLVFGWDKVTPRFHFVAAFFVAIGSMFSAVWIIVANSWQQTPAGHRIASHLVNGVSVARAETVSFWSVVFNPSTMNRLTHTLIGAFVLGSFFILSISAWYLLHGKHLDFAKRSFTGGLIVATLSSLGMLISGDFNSRMVAMQQPAKLAAFEGHYHTGPAELNLFGVPDEQSRSVKYGMAIPGMLSFLVYGDAKKPVTGLDRIPRQYWPPVQMAFQSYHIMVTLGMTFIGLTLLASYLRWRGTLFEKRWLLWIFVVALIAPFIANELGWAAAEVGRQPWIVHPRVLLDTAGEPLLDTAGMLQYDLREGLLTKDGVSKSISGGQVLSSILMFSVVYLLLFWVWIYVLNDKIHKGPKPAKIPVGTKGGWLAAAAEQAGSFRISIGGEGLMDIHVIWFCLLGVLLGGYAVLDGFDLGVGILHLLARTDEERRLSINSIGPIWDGNEVWLITFGGALFAAFPGAYASVFSGFYLAFMLLLFALIFRAVSIEFRSKMQAPAMRRFWDYGFFISSLLAALLFGVAVGDSMIGIALDGQGDYTGSFFDLLDKYALFAGVLAVALFAMHGSLYLLLRLPDGAARERVRSWMWHTWGVFLVLYVLGTIYTIVAVPRSIANFERFPWAAAIVVVNVLAVANIPRSVMLNKPAQAFASSTLTILCLVALFGVALFPNLVTARNNPANTLTIYNVASSDGTLWTMFGIALIGMPFVITYTSVVYWTFRGRVVLGDHSY